MLRRKSSNASEKEPAQVQKKKLSLQRSSSFKDFMKPKPTSPVVADKEFTLGETLVEDEALEDSGKGSSKLGKRWRAVITRTMTRRTSKMVQKTLAEEGLESGEDSPVSPASNDWTPDLCSGQRTSMCSSESEDASHPPLSRQFSGCGDRQSLDSGYSQRDSMRLEDSPAPYNGPFCGRALVHTDFTPSPYDIESLKLQKGDIIDIIEKPPVGTWTGKLNNKVGSFKFIYVTLLPDEATPPLKRRGHGKRHRSKPKTLTEVLERISLTELSPLLCMHGFDNLDNFRGLKESHLNELNIMEPDHRSKLLSTAELLQDSDGETDEGEEDGNEKTPATRDSGCFESTENLENGREEAEPEAQTEPQTKQEPEAELQQDLEPELDAVLDQLQDLTVEDTS
ncbi:SAM and SH3 domain-containing protein 3 [Scleropages formosus]|uniref:SAM and SH3 domain containing 3 n=2 Tax=Scleropages formosus TaxID=113540 RepID=A0A8C9R4R1_SCLFO|nr:SAM and SH3 domain-containing protein 3 [Scleropages formosus]